MSQDALNIWAAKLNLPYYTSLDLLGSTTEAAYTTINKLLQVIPADAPNFLNNISTTGITLDYLNNLAIYQSCLQKLGVAYGNRWGDITVSNNMQGYNINPSYVDQAANNMVAKLRQQLGGDADTLRQQLADANATIGALQTRAQTAEAYYADATARLSGVTAERDTATAALTACQTTVAQLTAELDKFRSDDPCRDVRAELDKATATIKTLEDTNAELTAELEKFRQDDPCRDVKQKLEEATSTIKSLETTNAELKTELDKVTSTTKALEAANAELTARNEDLTAAAAGVGEQLAAAQEEAQAATTAHTSLLRQLEAVNGMRPNTPVEQMIASIEHGRDLRALLAAEYDLDMANKSAPEVIGDLAAVVAQRVRDAQLGGNQR